MAEPTVMNNRYRVFLIFGVRSGLNEQLVEADDLEVLPSGALVFNDVSFVDPQCQKPRITPIAWFAPGSWHSVFRIFTGVTGGEWTAWTDELSERAQDG